MRAFLIVLLVFAGCSAEQYKPSKEYFGELMQFATLLDEWGDIMQYVDKVRPGDSADEAKVIVNANWFYEPKEMQLQFAQLLQQKWASVNSGGGTLTIVDQLGNRVGGSQSSGNDIVIND